MEHEIALDLPLSVATPLVLLCLALGAYMSAALGVSVIGFAPFCFFNLLSPLLTVVFTALGFRVLRSVSGHGSARPPQAGTGG